MLNRVLTILAFVVVATVMLPVMAFADDWVAVKLRGGVLQLVDGDWSKLERGAVVPDDRVIRTLGNGRVDFQRDAEVISLGGYTQVRIHDRAGRRFTTVEQYFGTVEVEVEVQNVQHFAVETPFLAAVVKGTHFIVKSDDKESSVKVTRGQVEVTHNDTGAHVLVPAGQTATLGEGEDVVLTGKGAKATSVVGADGKVKAKATDAVGADGKVITVAGTSVGVDVGPGGLGVEVTTPIGVDAGVGVGGGGVAVDVGLGDTDIGLAVGGGNGVSLNLGGASLHLGLGGLL